MAPPVTNSNQQLAKVIARQQLLPTHILDELVSRAGVLQEWLGQVAIEDDIISDVELAQAIAKDQGLSVVDPTTLMPPPDALETLPAETCRDYGVLPMQLTGRALTLLMANPLDEESKTTLSSLLGLELTVRVAPLTALRKAIDRCYATLASRVVTAPNPVPTPTASTHTTNRPANVSAAISEVFAKTALQPEQLRVDISSGAPTEDYTLDELLVIMYESRASDLHLAVGSPPMMRIDGELMPMNFPKMTPKFAQSMIYAVLTDLQITDFERCWELDFAYSLAGISRFRVNVHKQRGSVGAVLRVIPKDMPTLDRLNMPPVVREMTMRPRGLVLVTGPTGSGKSTTLAAMIDEINSHTRTHIVTIEDPIEFLHSNKMSVVTQREVGEDTQGFAVALRHVLRQDPDVILIGEMRDLETITAAVTAAETGHLVFATLHTTSAAQTIDRVIDVFPPHQQEQIRSQLSTVLEGILTQTLLPNSNGHGRSCAQEILICTPAIRNLIREGKVHQMQSVIQASGKYGMQTLDQALKNLVVSRKVTLEEAIKKCSNPEDFKALVAAG